MEQYPEYRVRIVKKDSSWTGFREMMGEFDRSIDCIHTVLPQGVENDQMLFEPFGEYDLQAVVLKSNELAKYDHLSMKDLAGKKVLLPALYGAVWDQMVETLHKLDCPIDVLPSDAGNYLDRFTGIADKNTITIAYGGRIGGYPALKALSVDWDFSLPFGMLYPKYHSQMRRFIHCVKEHMKHYDEEPYHHRR